MSFSALSFSWFLRQSALPYWCNRVLKTRRRQKKISTLQLVISYFFERWLGVVVTGPAENARDAEDRYYTILQSWASKPILDSRWTPSRPAHPQADKSKIIVIHASIIPLRVHIFSARCSSHFTFSDFGDPCSECMVHCSPHTFTIFF